MLLDSPQDVPEKYLAYIGTGISPDITKRGKKQASEALEPEASISALTLRVPPTLASPKKSKRVETRPCPVCNESIPLRLIPAHALLENERVQDIMMSIGSTDFLGEEYNARLVASSRRSAVRARKTITARSLKLLDTVSRCGKTIETIKRHRKKRNMRLREITKDEDDMCAASSAARSAFSCPICLHPVGGDEDEKSAHVDACLTFEAERLRAQEIGAREGILNGSAEAEVDGMSFRGTGFYIRDRNAQDVEDEIDIDGEDEQVFGDPQFTEEDILPLSTEASCDGERDDQHPEGYPPTEDKTLRELVAEGKGMICNKEATQTIKVIDPGIMDAIDKDIASARRLGHPAALIIALEAKVKQLELMRMTGSTSLLCRICLDPYSEPTTSTGCWHTCCQECWLRCLGSNKLCPICKRITTATELRRIYL